VLRANIMIIDYLNSKDQDNEMSSTHGCQQLGMLVDTDRMLGKVMYWENQKSNFFKDYVGILNYNII